MTRADTPPSGRPGPAAWVSGPLARFALFFAIAFGLGYPTLARYNPATAGNPDSAYYQEMVRSGSTAGGPTWNYRVLLPFLAHPVAQVARGRVGTWDPVLFAMLVVSAAFVAASLVLLAWLGHQYSALPVVPLVAALLYLLNWTVAHGHLAGLVDSADGFFILLMTVSLAAGRAGWLLPIALVAPLAKETFLVVAPLFSAGWLLAERRLSRPRALALAALVGAAALSSLTVLRFWIDGHWTWPWGLAAGVRADVSPVGAFRTAIFDRNLWYVLYWLLPLSVLGLRAWPRAWRAGAAAACAGVLALVLWNNAAGGGLGRALFSVAGPLLCLAGAHVLVSAAMARGARHG
ncbi:MAG TPA: hypothetical protein VK928_07115 [Longimicrobiales bacterium]|nr:hypothetical protein [Longimicrobiales bacterium]